MENEFRDWVRGLIIDSGSVFSGAGVERIVVELGGRGAA